MRGRFREKTTPRRYWRSIKGGLESRQSRDGNGFALTLGEPTESGRKRLRADDWMGRDGLDGGWIGWGGEKREM